MHHVWQDKAAAFAARNALRLAARCGPPRCWTPARGRSGAAPPPPSPSAPRMISHMISSMPSEPLSRRNSRRVILRSSSVSAGQLVEEGIVELGIDEAGARALELVAHAAGAPDLHVETRGIALAPHRGSPRPAASSARPEGVGNCVTLTASGITLHRPFLDLAEHQRRAARCRPWSTSMWFISVRSNSSSTSCSARCPASIDMAPSPSAPGAAPSLRRRASNSSAHAEREGRHHVEHHRARRGRCSRG